MVALVAAAQAQGHKKVKLITVSGTVTDTTLLPVAGALIVVDGQSMGVTTGKQGTFKVKIRPDAATIGAYTVNLGSAMTMYEGQAPITLVLDGREALINFKPEAGDGEMDIQVGYGTVKKKNLTSQVGYIDGQDDINLAYTNIYDMIQGKVPGVQVTGNKIVIRGINSINLSSDPLLVVDGIVVNSIDNISPRQVKSITVLKGPDAAIYGSRGANGVIIINLMGPER